MPLLLRTLPPGALLPRHQLEGRGSSLVRDVGEQAVAGTDATLFSNNRWADAVGGIGGCPASL